MTTMDASAEDMDGIPIRYQDPEEFVGPIQNIPQGDGLDDPS